MVGTMVPIEKVLVYQHKKYTSSAASGQGHTVLEDTLYYITCTAHSARHPPSAASGQGHTVLEDTLYYNVHCISHVQHILQHTQSYTAWEA